LTNLEDPNVGRPIRTVAAAVPFDVFEPLNVRLCVAVDFTVELDVAAHHCCDVGWQTGLQDGPVWGALCVGRKLKERSAKWAKMKEKPVESLKDVCRLGATVQRQFGDMEKEI